MNDHLVEVAGDGEESHAGVDEAGVALAAGLAAEPAVEVLAAAHVFHGPKNGYRIEHIASKKMNTIGLTFQRSCRPVFPGGSMWLRRKKKT